MLPVTAMDIHTTLAQYRKEVSSELDNILQWWMLHMPDKENGGFYGSVDNINQPVKDAEKGIVLNARILWTFSAAYRFASDPLCLDMTRHAFEYITNYFIDKQHGGLYWSVTAEGKPKQERKQIYGLAFGIYGLSEYYRASADEYALQLAKELYYLIEQYSLDKKEGGYIEAFAANWQPLDDLRLSEKDDNEKKTMNTHLHIIEAYTNLYRAWPDEQLKEKIIALLELFDKFIINKETGHLNLFMDEHWRTRSSLISFGHDIEAAWLLYESAEVIEHTRYINRYRQLSVRLADAAAKGLDHKNGGLWYEYEPRQHKWVLEKHSWPQAEAMAGFLHAYQLTNRNQYLQYSLQAFEFVNRHIKDHKNGEWFWGIDEHGDPVQKEKAGFWKCPYHSTRACMEVANRLEHLLK